MTVFPSSRNGLQRSRKSAPDPRKPSRLRLPLGLKMLISCIIASTVPPNFQPPSVGS